MKAAFLLAFVAVATFASPVLAQSSNEIRERNNRELDEWVTELREDFEFVVRADAFERCRLNTAISEETCKRISGVDKLSTGNLRASK